MIKERIWTKDQLWRLYELKQEHRIPQCVVAEVERVIQILDCNYGMSRDVDNDDGGYVLLLLSENTEEVKEEYTKILHQYYLTEDMAEFKDVLSDDEKSKWSSDLFLVSNDYGVTIVHPFGEEEEF